MGGTWGKRSRNRALAAASEAFGRTKPEVTGVLLLLFGTFFCLSLASYDGIGPDGLPAGTNLMGAAGRYAAFVSLQVFGLTAGYYVAMALVLGAIWLTSERDDVTSGVVLAYAVAGLLVAALAHLGAPSDVLLGGHLIGGAAGELIGTTLSAIFSAWGARLVAFGAIALLVLVATPAALKESLLRAGRAARIVGRGAAACASLAVRAWRLAGEAAASHAEQPERADVGGAEPSVRPAESPAAQPVVIAHRASAPAARSASESVARTTASHAAPEADERRIAEMFSTLDEQIIERAFDAARAVGFLDPAFSVVDPIPAAPAEASAAPVIVAPAPLEARKPRPAVRRAARVQAPRPGYVLPPLDLLTDPPPASGGVDEQVLREYAAKLAATLADYGIEGSVVEIHPGPVVTTYEFRPAPGTKLSRISALENDIAMAMAVMKVRIVAPIPGKNAVGFEVPNPVRETVYLKEILADPAFGRRAGALPIAVGKDLTGRPYCADLARMPHLLVAGATGTGKSVFINATLMSLLFRQKPEDMKLILVDPKHVELISYDRIPHLLLPVVSDMRKAALALRWAIDEMERRYHLFASIGARQISHYNQKVAARLAGKDEPTPAAPAADAARVRIVVKGPDGARTEVAPAGANPRRDLGPIEKLPSIVIVIDELAELMAVAAKDVESAIQRLAQKGRAAGIHLIVATQRPSVDVVTGTIKANFPTRLSFKVSSKTDSRTVLDQNGADQLLGLGDMLLLPPGTSDLIRIQGTLVGEDDIERVVAHIRVQGEPVYDESIVADRDGDRDDENADGEGYDEHWTPALELVLRIKQASISKIQRHLRIGYNRAARIVERMEREGLIGPGDNPREKQIYAAKIMERLEGDAGGGQQPPVGYQPVAGAVDG